MCLASEAGDEFGQIHLPEVFTAAGPHGHLFSRLFLFADNQLVRQLLQAMFPNFIGYFFIPQVGLAAPPRLLQIRCNASAYPAWPSEILSTAICTGASHSG